MLSGPPFAITEELAPFALGLGPVAVQWLDVDEQVQWPLRMPSAEIIGAVYREDFWRYHKRDNEGNHEQ